MCVRKCVLVHAACLCVCVLCVRMYMCVYITILQFVCTVGAVYMQLAPVCAKLTMTCVQVGHCISTQHSHLSETASLPWPK